MVESGAWEAVQWCNMMPCEAVTHVGRSQVCILWFPEHAGHAHAGDPGLGKAGDGLWREDSVRGAVPLSLSPCLFFSFSFMEEINKLKRKRTHNCLQKMKKEWAAHSLVVKGARSHMPTVFQVLDLVT